MQLLRLFALTVSLSAIALNIAAQDNFSGAAQNQILQQLQNMSPEEQEALVKNLMVNADAIQKCVEQAGGEDAVAELTAIGDAHHQQVNALCQSGQREKAQAYAQDASQEMLRDSRVTKLRDCSRSAMQNMPQLAQLAETGGLDTSKHVCD